ncbi:PilZ domain-containing protein [Mariprofundus sp. EBB-1]|uniref:PilZ domain-containing protein n=1 Tax=Mariprofundus sp. EBB-1 TaxID=2650971 RepID=UPI000EF1A53E|nr:PilZ domain-containing protein [Mariprofundus sp. EBB-1]RLL51961.1 PilZ domain-containing protein [Mariprofundus sp. EBB-1]
MPDDQNRAFQRTTISLPAQITPADGDPFDAVIKDLSLHGTWAKAKHDLKIGQACKITIQFENHEDELPIHAEGAITRVEDHHFGIKFDTIGFESHEELESMILQHSNNKEQCLKEFTKESFFFDPLSAFDFDPMKPR